MRNGVPRRRKTWLTALVQSLGGRDHDYLISTQVIVDGSSSLGDGGCNAFIGEEGGCFWWAGLTQRQCMARPESPEPHICALAVLSITV